MMELIFTGIVMRAYILPLLVILTACQTMDPSNFGMSEQEWNNLSYKQQTALRKKYSETAKAHTLITHAKYQTPYPEILFKINGQALMWPDKKFYSFKPITSRIKSGQCAIVNLISKNNAAHTSAEVCYNGKQLTLDPSHWQVKYAQGGLIINRHHLWQQGMDYQNLNSSGFAMLRKTNISIRAI